MKLNKDQEKALTFLMSWYKGNQTYAILDGKAGVGKTFLVKYFLNLINADTLLLAPTHQARKQLESALGKDKKPYKHEFRTLDSALGIYPTTVRETLDFEHLKLPEVWDNYELAIGDEGSMYADWKLDIQMDIGMKTLYIGHKSQLPPVVKNKTTYDPCISPIFEKDIPTISLTIPQRNVGKGWDFCNWLEEIIYMKVANQTDLIPPDFDISRDGLQEYLTSSKGIQEIRDDKLKVLAWSNVCVDKFNLRIRRALFKKDSVHKFCPEDKLILIEPLTLINDLSSYSSKDMIKLMNQNNLVKCYSNSAMVVINFEEVVIKLEHDLRIPVHKILVKSEYGQHYIYVLKFDNDWSKIDHYYNLRAWSTDNADKRKKVYREKFFILSCFAKIKYFYAATAYRMQGSSIDKVIVIETDVRKNTCLAEQAKTRYVAASRHKEEVFIYRGIF